MKKKKKREINLEKLLINIFITVLLVLFIVIILYYFLIFNTKKFENTWDVHFNRIINSVCSEDTICTTPTIYKDSTTTGDYTVEFSESNTKSVYEIDVYNDGYVDAEIRNIILGAPSCKGNSSNLNDAYDDASKVCSKLSYKLLDKNNNEIRPGTILKAKEKDVYYLSLSYDDNNTVISVDEVLTDSVIVRNLNLSIDYSQVK